MAACPPRYRTSGLPTGSILVPFLWAMAMGDLLDTLELRCDEIRSIPFHLRTAQPREPAGHSLLRAAIHELQLSDDGTLRRTAVPAVFPTIVPPPMRTVLRTRTISPCG
eukprot:gene12073-biopygen8825